MQKIIIDTDIGDDIDDALALALALRTEALDILGITTVFHNAKERAKLAMALLSKYNRDIPVFAGCDNAILQPFYAYVNPVTGICPEVLVDGKYIPPQCKSEIDCFNVSDMHAVNFIIESAKKYGKDLKIVTIGPLINLALAILLAPDVMKTIDSISMMGGVFLKPELECNINCCPESANIVFNSGIPLNVVSIDVTDCCKLSDLQREQIQNHSGEDVQYLAVLMQRWLNYYHFATPCLHDPLTVAVLTEDFVKFKKCRYKLSMDGENRGKFYPDENGIEINLSVGVDKEKFIDYFMKKVAT